MQLTPPGTQKAAESHAFIAANCGEILNAPEPAATRSLLTLGPALPYLTRHGWVAEWFKAPVLKTGVGATPP